MLSIYQSNTVMLGDSCDVNRRTITGVYRTRAGRR